MFDTAALWIGRALIWCVGVPAAALTPVAAFFWLVDRGLRDTGMLWSLSLWLRSEEGQKATFNTRLTKIATDGLLGLFSREAPPEGGEAGE